MRLSHGVTALAVVCAAALSGCSLSQVPYEESAWKTVVSTELAELDGAPGYYLRSEVSSVMRRSVIDYEYLPKDEADPSAGRVGHTAYELFRDNGGDPYSLPGGVVLYEDVDLSSGARPTITVYRCDGGKSKGAFDDCTTKQGTRVPNYNPYVEIHVPRGSVLRGEGK
jgi:lipoprotein